MDSVLSRGLMTLIKTQRRRPLQSLVGLNCFLVNAVNVILICNTKVHYMLIYFKIKKMYENDEELYL